MEKGLKELLESEVLSDATKKSLTEAWKQKEEKIRESVKKEVLESFKARFEEDKTNLTLAMNDMLNEAIQKYATESATEAKKLKEERKNLAESMKQLRKEQTEKLDHSTKAMEGFIFQSLKQEIDLLKEEQAHYHELRDRNKAYYQSKLNEHIGMLQKLVADCLTEQLSELEDKATALDEQRRVSLKNMRDHRIAVNKKMAEHIETLDKFVTNTLNEEMAEFNRDKKKLAETKSRCILESNRKIKETQDRFIRRASRIVESTVHNQLTSTITNLKEDIKEAKRNAFARKIFESFQDEFRAAHLEDSKEMTRLANQVERMKEELNEAREQARRSEHRQRMVEERAQRQKVMSDLLRPLSSEKREQMESLLESTKTENLKESFKRHLKTLYGENVNKDNGRHALLEDSYSSRTVTGNRNSRLSESALRKQNAEEEEIATLRKLAGLTK